ncbi:MAG: cupin domain-containing protein [Candidatus Hydrogenedentes bacterium]|jgi:hypothetical protein|nr:cupin domain-containing protein [Candidatus Hydrogenedentota bacterium]
MVERGPFSNTARRLARRGFHCTLQNSDAGEVHKNTVRDSDTLIVAMDGVLEVEFKGATHFPSSGREILVPAWVSHTVRNGGTERAAWIRASQIDLVQTD